MAQVLPAEGGLRRIIGDGDGCSRRRGRGTYRPRPDRALPRDGAPADVRRALGRLPPPGPHRHLRDLLESRGHAGRLRLRARGRRLDLPELPRVGDRAAARDAGGDHPLLVARPSRRLVESRRLQRRLDLRPDRHARPARGGARLGEEAEGRERLRDRVLRRRSDLGGSLPRGRQLRGRPARAADPLLQQQPVGDLDAGLRADRRRLARGQGDRLRDAGRARGRAGRPRRLRGDARRGRARAGRRGAVVHRGGFLPGGAARDRGRSRARTSTSSGSRRRRSASASAATRVTCAAPGC